MTKALGVNLACKAFKRLVPAVFFLLPAVAAAQPIAPTPETVFTEALEYMQAGDYQEALPLLLGLRAKGQESAGVSFRIGECYLNLKGQKQKALSYLKEASEHVSNAFTGDYPDENRAPLKTWIYLGIAYRLNDQFDAAEKSFESFLRVNDPNDSLNLALVLSHLEKCRNARVLMSAPAKIETDTLSVIVNNGFSNYNPVVSSDETQLFYMDQQKFYEAAMRSIKAGVDWQKPDNLTPDLGSDGDQILTGISGDGNTLLFSFTDPMTRGDIYLSEYRNGKWSRLKKLETPISTQFNESHACLSPDGELYFTSDRKGGFGGLDIYRAKKDARGSWGNPINLGSAINSPYNEETPFLNAGGTSLYFSSQGHYNMGGYDLFRSDLSSDGGWLPPVNLGYPLNTTDDDMFFFPAGKEEAGYSYRFQMGSAQSDLVHFRIITAANPARFTVHGTINLPVKEADGLKVKFSTTADQSEIADISVKNGSFSQALPAGDFTIGFTWQDSVLLQKFLHIPAYLPQNDLIMLTDISLPKKETHDTLRIEDIRFAYDQSDLAAEYHPFLDAVAATMEKYRGIQMLVSGYSDARGNETYNLKLSRARAESVAAYLNRKPDLTSRITVQAFGEKNAVALNQSDDGKDLAEGRKYNRRVELILVSQPENLVVELKRDIPTSLRAK